MPEPLEQAVVAATLHVLQTSAFMTAGPWSEDDGELPAPDAAATMVFRGPVCGRLTLHVASAILPTLTLNMLGEYGKEEERAERGLDALCEVLNMICGNLLPLWQGPEPAFKLSPPEIVDLHNAPPASDGRTLERVRFNLENTLAVLEVATANDLSCTERRAPEWLVEERD
jgi:hypothetical protein